MGGNIFFTDIFVLVLIAPLIHSRSTQNELYRALREASPDPTVSCIDRPQCGMVDDICQQDHDLVAVLCPVKCGLCVCQDSASTQGNCSELIPDICEDDLAHSICARSCGLCGEAVNTTCEDHVVRLTCASLPDPCSDAVGQIICPLFCGLCEVTTTSPMTMTMDTTLVT